MRVLKIKVLDYTTEYVATVYLAYSNLLKDGGCSVRDIKTKLRELMTPVDLAVSGAEVLAISDT